MSKRFEHDEVSKVSFHDLLNAAMPALKSKAFVNIDYNELSIYASCIQCKVQKDLFEVVEETAPRTITWEDFILVMRGKKELQDKCIDIIGRKLETAFFQYDFASRKADPSKRLTAFDGDIIRGARLFSDAEGILLASLFLFFAEQTHLNYLRETVRPEYTWEEYYYDLQHDIGQWMEVLTAFRNTIMELDFKTDWQEDGCEL